MYKTILVPTDGSTLSDKAIVAAVDFAKMTGGKLIGLSVAEPYPFMPLEGTYISDTNLYEQKTQQFAEMHVKKVADAAAKENVLCETHVVSSFSPYEAILEMAKEQHCDVIFMASHGRKGLSRLFVGSETQKVLAHSPIPVLVFR